jgi:glycosyltransferase involved in cell wall biosynthesis
MVPCGDRDALADALVRLIDDETLRARLGKRGRQEALQYGWDRVTDQVLDVYHSILGRLAVVP